ncbi:glycosyltransferase [Kocuria rhizosphaericola]|uniref:glycosyltransferase n=1 Tax=Kocuria rhizosphaericola TaxID=3376284 RepID=UPI0037B16B9B
MPAGQRPGGPAVSVVIPAFNEEAVLRRCLQAVLAQTVTAEQIIVVDNASTDGTRAVVTQMQAEHPDASLLLIEQNAEQGLIPTRNIGLDSSRAEVLGRIDADSVLAPNWVEQVQRAFKDPDLAATTGPVLYYDLPLPRLGLTIDNAGRQVVMKLVADRHPFLYGSNMAIRRTAWQQIRSTVCRDEHDRMHEDIDLSLHLSEHGLKIAYLPAMIAGVSARRMDDTPEHFRYYVERYRRTYSAHQTASPIPVTATIVLRSLYWPLKLCKLLYLPRTPLRATTPPTRIPATEHCHERLPGHGGGRRQRRPNAAQACLTTKSQLQHGPQGT